MLRLLLTVGLLQLRPCTGCTYDQANGVPCVSGPIAATKGNAEDAPGGVQNLGDTGEAAVYACISDWGGDANVSAVADGDPVATTPAQLAAARALLANCADNGCKAVLSAGNNVLPFGLQGAADSAAVQARWTAGFTDVYGGLSVPWYATGGYADWEGNITAERALTSSSATSGFHYPTLWQSVELVVPPGYSTLRVLLLDTVTLLGSLGSATRRHLRDFNTVDAPPPESELQWTWLQDQLDACTADWLVVVGNDPVYSAGAVGPSPLLQARLLPMLASAGAALYVSGRDHVAQHFRPTAAAPLLDTIVIGNGAGGDEVEAAALQSAAANPAGALAWSYGGSAGFATLSFALSATTGAPQLTVAFYGQDEGAGPLYSFTKNATRTGTASAPPPVGGPHGARSGLILLVMLAGGSAASFGYIAAQSIHPGPKVADEEAPIVAKLTRAKKKAKAEARSLLEGLSDAEKKKRFNTFSL